MIIFGPSFNNMKWKDIAKITGIPVLIASLCCLSPLVLALLGISTVAFAGSLADKLYYEYACAFRSAGIISLMIALVIYFRSKGVCTLDQAKKRRNEIINTSLIVLVVGILGYIVWLYGIVEVIGVFAGVWENL